MTYPVLHRVEVEPLQPGRTGDLLGRLHQGPRRGVDDLELATLSWFNHGRLHGSIGNMPPIEFETLYYRHNQPAQRPPAEEPSLH